MMNYYEKVVKCYIILKTGILKKTAGLLREEKGDLVSSLGWMAIMALVLVVIKGLVDGKLIGYVNTVFLHLDRVFSP